MHIRRLSYVDDSIFAFGFFNILTVNQRPSLAFLLLLILGFRVVLETRFLFIKNFHRVRISCFLNLEENETISKYKLVKLNYVNLGDTFVMNVKAEVIKKASAAVYIADRRAGAHGFV